MAAFSQAIAMGIEYGFHDSQKCETWVVSYLDSTTGKLTHSEIDQT